METITIVVGQSDVYAEVAKATDYTGSKLIDGDAAARDRILAVDEDFAELGRFWDETIAAVEEWLKEMYVSSDVTEDDNGDKKYEVTLEVSKSWDSSLKGSLQSNLRSYFISSIIGAWFVFANKTDSEEYLANAAELLVNMERILYTRRRPKVPTTS